MAGSDSRPSVQPKVHRFARAVRIEEIDHDDGGTTLEVRAPLDVARAVVALKRFRGLSAMARTTTVAILPYWGASGPGQRSAASGGGAWLIPVDRLQAEVAADRSGQQIGATSRVSVDVTQGPQSAIPSDLAVLYVSGPRITSVLHSVLPEAAGFFVFMPHGAPMVLETGAVSFQQVSWGSRELRGGSEGVVGLTEDGTLSARPRSPELTPAGPLQANGDTAISSPAAPGATPAAPEVELARAGDVTYYKRISVRGPRGRRQAVWKRFRYDELVVTSRRLIFASNGVRQQQLSLDPMMAARALQAASGLTGRLQLSDDVASQIPFIVEFTPRTYVFRLIPMPSKLRPTLWVLTFFFSLGLFPLVHTATFAVPVVTFVLIYLGIPAPWPGIRVVATSGQLALNRASSAVLRGMSYGLSTRLSIPNPQQRQKVIECVASQVREVRAALTS